MVNAQLTKVLLIAACIIAGTCVMEGMSAYKTLKGKAANQGAVTEKLDRWKQSYQALAESRTKWERNYRKEDSVEDLMGLISLVNLPSFGLTSDQDKISLISLDQVVQGGSALGLTKICMGTGTGDGGALSVSAASYKDLLGAIDQMARRPDIYIGGITLQGDKDKPTARLSEFCVLLRNA